MTGLTPRLFHPVQKVLRELGDSGSIQNIQSVGGGCINQVFKLTTEKRNYLLKLNSLSLPGMFTAEAQGLSILAKTNTIKVPEVLSISESNDDNPAFILLEWLDPNEKQVSYERFGEQLAQLHRCKPLLDPHNRYGLNQNNYLGSTVQANFWSDNWVQFYGEARLKPQLELGVRNHRLARDQIRKLEEIISRLDNFLGGVIRVPSLIHGDLWIGNLIPGPDGFALIDPAISYSDREAEIAYTELFGGFSPKFYSAYQYHWPLEPGYADRRDLYNLYHLLNHLNLFGESYIFQVDLILRRYAAR